MLSKIFTCLNKIKSGTSLCTGFVDLAEFLANAWVFGQHLSIILIAVWVPVLKLTAFLMNNFNINISKFITQHHAKTVFWALYGFSACAGAYNLAKKIWEGCCGDKLIVPVIIYLFLLIMDFIETREFLKKLED